jgi:catechol 2,3-dioxygenase-like lactoylglutathione lyase family enzyme
MNVLFVAGFGPILQDEAATTAFYRDTLGLPFDESADGYYHSEKVPGVKAFALWPLSHAAQSCFGTDSWPTELPIPQAWLEFDVDDIETATTELEGKGYHLLVKSRTEPWGQTVTRLLSPEGILVGVTVTPWMRDDTR